MPSLSDAGSAELNIMISYRYAPIPALIMLLSGEAIAAGKIVGKYVSGNKNICFVGSPDASGKTTYTDCSVHRDEVIIRKTPDQYSIALSFAFSNGHTCEFSGVAPSTVKNL